jgi:flagellar basal body-associated protein FliL
MESSGDLQYFELPSITTNLGGPIKARYLTVELKFEGLAGDFEKVLELNEHRIRDKALQIMGGYTYEDAQLDGFQERVRVDLKKGFSIILKEYQVGKVISSGISTLPNSSSSNHPFLLHTWKRILVFPTKVSI